MTDFSDKYTDLIAKALPCTNPHPWRDCIGNNHSRDCLARHRPAVEAAFATALKKATLQAFLDGTNYDPASDGAAKIKELREADKARIAELEQERKDYADALFNLRNRAGCGPEQRGPDIWQRAEAAEAHNEKLAGALSELGMMCLQSNRYNTDANFTVATDNALRLARDAALQEAAPLRNATEKELQAQKESWVRGEMAMGSDADEAAERAKLRKAPTCKMCGGEEKLWANPGLNGQIFQYRCPNPDCKARAK